MCSNSVLEPSVESRARTVSLAHELLDPRRQCERVESAFVGGTSFPASPIISPPGIAAGCALKTGDLNPSTSAIITFKMQSQLPIDFRRQ
jgi:hypothetical protein